MLLLGKKQQQKPEQKTALWNHCSEDFGGVFLCSHLLGELLECGGAHESAGVLGSGVLSQLTTGLSHRQDPLPTTAERRLPCGRVGVWRQ